VAQLTIGPVHHIRLSVNDLDRSRAFYTELLGFEVAMDSLPPEDDPHYVALAYNLQDGILLMNAGLIIGLRPTDPARRDANDTFDPFRVGLDHLSFNVESKPAMEEAIKIMDDWGVTHGEIYDLVPFGIAVLPFRDPDGIQLELTAPL
jgi:catechol 2,3-dioxygenase-like lactoylglutathione lyase family enzyme